MKLAFALRQLAAATLGVATLGAAAVQPAACSDSKRWFTSAEGYRLAFASVPAPLASSRHFQLDVVVCAAPNPLRGLRVDADMPAHRHGMNYRASVKRLAADHWRAEGLMFHMSGRWRFIFDLDTAAGPLRLTHEVEVD